MRRSSSTIRRWGASSAGAASGAVIGNSRPSIIVSGASSASGRLIGALDELSHPGAILWVDHRGQEASRGIVRTGAKLSERRRDSRGLQIGELQGQRATLVGDMQEPLPAVVLALLLQHVTLVDQLLENPAKRLLGDAQQVQQFGDLHAGMAIDKVKHPMVRPAKSEFR